MAASPYLVSFDRGLTDRSWLTASPEAEIAGVGATGLSPEEEYLNRERKYSATGVDVRRFSKGKKSGLAPQDDPYYGRKKVSGNVLFVDDDFHLEAARIIHSRGKRKHRTHLLTDHDHRR